jgi:hypothetical protein
MSNDLFQGNGIIESVEQTDEPLRIVGNAPAMEFSEHNIFRTPHELREFINDVQEGLSENGYWRGVPGVGTFRVTEVQQHVNAVMHQLRGGGDIIESGNAWLAQHEQEMQKEKPWYIHDAELYEDFLIACRTELLRQGFSPLPSSYDPMLLKALESGQLDIAELQKQKMVGAAIEILQCVVQRFQSTRRPLSVVIDRAVYDAERDLSPVVLTKGLLLQLLRELHGGEEIRFEPAPEGGIITGLIVDRGQLKYSLLTPDGRELFVPRLIESDDDGTMHLMMAIEQLAAEVCQISQREAALRRLNDKLREALMWAGASPSFGPGGVAEQGWLNVCVPVLLESIDTTLEQTRYPQPELLALRSALRYQQLSQLSQDNSMEKVGDESGSGDVFNGNPNNAGGCPRAQRFAQCESSMSFGPSEATIYGEEGQVIGKGPVEDLIIRFHD